MKTMRALNDRGSTVVIAVTIALAAAILILSASRSLLFNSHQVVYFNAMNRVYRLAETGSIKAIGRLTVDPEFYIAHPDLVTNVTEPGEGIYTVNISSRNDVVGSGYYFVTVATVTVGGHSYCTALHTHLRISNAADYFWAVKERLVLTSGIDAGGGKVYSTILEFLPQVSTNVTTVRKAEFLASGSVTPTRLSGRYNAADINILEPNTSGDVNIDHRPVALSAEIVFPQVLTSDLLRYQQLAHIGSTPNHGKCDFQGTSPTALLNVYPPGYVGGIAGGDPYVNHTNNNFDHVYYCAGPGAMTIGNVMVFGQVLFVAEGDIRITGNIYSESNASATMPGGGATNISSSTANQAVLITKANVVLTRNFHPADTLTYLETVEAMIMAPHGSLSAEPYGEYTYDGGGAVTGTAWGTPDMHTKLRLLISSSMIFARVESNPPNNLPTVFQAPGLNPRTYKYMQSLKDHPPFYMPALAEIHWQYEETRSSGSMF